MMSLLVSGIAEQPTADGNAIELTFGTRTPAGKVDHCRMPFRVVRRRPGGILLDVNNTALPKPHWPLEVVRDSSAIECTIQPAQASPSRR